MVPRYQFTTAKNPGLLRELWKSSLGLYVVMLLVYLATLTLRGGWPIDLHDFVVGRDFLNLWMAGGLGFLEDPAQYYEADRFMAVLEAIVGPHQPGQLSYPPTQFLLGAPFALLPYGVAYGLWLALNLGVFWLALRGMFERRLILLLVLSPVGLIWLICGQSSLLTAALMLSAWRLRDARPWAAGVCVGLLVFKPLLAVLFPLLIVATGRWRMFFAAAATVLGVLALTLACYGVAPWVAYWEIGIPAQADVFLHTTDMVNSLTPTIFNDLRVLGLGEGWALRWQGVQALLAVAALVLGSRRVQGEERQMVLFFSLSLLSMFYVMAYDQMAWLVALVALVCAVELGPRERIFIGLCFWMPLVDFFLNAYGLVGASLLPVALVGWLFLRARFVKIA